MDRETVEDGGLDDVRTVEAEVAFGVVRDTVVVVVVDTG